MINFGKKKPMRSLSHLHWFIVKINKRCAYCMACPSSDSPPLKLCYWFHPILFLFQRHPLMRPRCLPISRAPPHKWSGVCPVGPTKSELLPTRSRFEYSVGRCIRSEDCEDKTYHDVHFRPHLILMQVAKPLGYPTRHLAHFRWQFFPHPFSVKPILI